jgi:hypothetical protein
VPDPSRALPAVLFAAAVFGVGGCGGGTKTTVKTVTKTATPTTSASTTGSTSAPPSGAGDAIGRVLHKPSFQSPTGNIGCMLGGGVARCDIVKRSWSPPARPANCPSQVDFGQGLEVDRSGKGRFVCAGDTARDPSAAKLAYGTASRVGDFLCISRTTGIACSNTSTNHGFAIGAQGYRLF